MADYNYRNLEVTKIQESKDGNTIIITGIDLDELLLDWDREDEEAHALREVRFDLTRLVNWQKQYFAFMNMVRTNRARIAYGERPFRSVQQVYRCTGEKTREVEGQL